MYQIDDSHQIHVFSTTTGEPLLSYFPKISLDSSLFYFDYYTKIAISADGSFLYLLAYSKWGEEVLFTFKCSTLYQLQDCSYKVHKFDLYDNVQFIAMTWVSTNELAILYDAWNDGGHHGIVTFSV